MTKVKEVVIKEAEINNNCPECFNQDMQLTFFQKHRVSRWYYQITAEVTHQMVCNTCHSTIYPVKWTDDIERTFEYYQKMVTPEKKGLKLSRLSFLLIILLLILAGVLYYLFYSGII
ncbi:hypothetical protein [Lentiprolixibacter aurantiacus]|uniref:Uncharacterized protein n=1 Tax=Lentiprolixibacter aurantiacus TaxID=2993939 RepID=A0AAE3MIN2_9FLAO|nr:hypothetical protein [Lentiprolixibacter aurantiacus]MCX2718256.1 hypothetical protein [Lentiprolixibacter aurantiacus]